MKSRVVLIYHHIFKNAGTSFNYALKQYFQDGFFEYDLPNSQIVTQEDLSQFIINCPTALAISSHHACMPSFQRDNYRKISYVLLRNPLARVESIYNFEKKQIAQTEGAIKAKQLDFKEYVLWRLQVTPIMFCNYQTHYCSRSSSSEINKNPTKEDLNKAIKNLNKCIAVGIVERYQDSLEVVNNVLRKNYPDIHLKYHHLNTTLNDINFICLNEQIKENLIKKLGIEIVNKLEQGNQLDQKLYEVGENILDVYLQKAAIKTL